MAIRRSLTAAAAAGLLAAPALACAQDLSGLAGSLAAGIEGLGQSVGEAAVGGSSVFVTATGRADLPGPLTDAYLVNVEGRSNSAVEAQRLRDGKLASARGAAAKYGVTMEVGSTAFSREADTAAQQRRRAQATAERLAHPGTPVVEPPSVDDDRVFVARTGVRFHAADPQRLPAFLDALKAAGVDSPTAATAGGLSSLLARSTEVLGFGAMQTVDPTVWDRASQAAVAEARRQAQVLAQASGRGLGEVRQVLMLSRTVQGSTAAVTIAVRFAFTPSSPR